MTAAKMEENYVREFLDHYKNLGIDHIFIGDNNNKDYFPQLSEIIKDYIDSGFVTIYDCRDVHIIQSTKYSIYNRMFDYYNIQDTYDWCFVCDMDEFLVLGKYNIKQYLDLFNADTSARIRIPWIVMDDNDLIYYEDKPLQTRLIRVSDKYYNDKFFESKMMFRTNLVTKDTYISSHYINVSNSHYVYKILPQYTYEFQNYHQCITSKQDKLIIDQHNIYLKHFRYKTLEEFIQKVYRGDAAKVYGGYCINKKEMFVKFFTMNILTKDKKEAFDSIWKNYFNE